MTDKKYEELKHWVVDFMSQLEGAENGTAAITIIGWETYGNLKACLPPPPPSREEMADYLVSHIYTRHEKDIEYINYIIEELRK